MEDSLIFVHDQEGSQIKDITSTVQSNHSFAILAFDPSKNHLNMTTEKLLLNGFS